MARREDIIGPDQIADLVDECILEHDVCSNYSDGLEESDHNTDCDIFGDDSVDDPDFVPQPEEQDSSEEDIEFIEEFCPTTEY